MNQATKIPFSNNRLRNTAEVSVSTLPPYRMGPYQLRIVAATQDMFTDKRRKVEADWNAGIVNIRTDAKESRVLNLLTRHLITAIHYRSGLNDSSDEESYAHSCASGLVELALGQRDFFVEYLTLIEKHIKPRAGWREVYLNARFIPAPKRIVCGARSCTIRFVAPQTCSKANAYGFYVVGQGVIELSQDLSGANLALVALHEKLHFMHECAGLKNRSTEAMFKTAQTTLFLNSLKDNPGYWRWWLSLLAQKAHGNR
jgi:cell division protein FtsL